MSNKKDNNNWIDSFLTEKSELSRGATSLRDLYLSYIEVGFKEDQAMDILKTVLTVTLMNNKMNGGD